MIWHTQGSGKSLLMAFYAGQIIKHPAMENPTLVVLTDRNDLDDQLFATFSMCKDLLRQTPQQAEDRDHLRRLLDRPSGGVIFTTMQKFSPEPGETDYPVLTDRRNVVVIADEAHRSQYGFEAKVERKTGDISYGFAKYLRDALPNASFIGFTGTPIEKDDVNTPAVFGDYIDIYDISRAVEDGATVPIYYESRLARIELDEDEKPKIDAEIADTDRRRSRERAGTAQAQMGERRGAGRRREAPRAGCRRPREAFRGPRSGARRQGDDRLHEPAHLRRALRRDRQAAPGLAQRRRRGRRDQGRDDRRGVRPAGVAAAYRQAPKARRELLAKRAKDPKDPLKLVIVRDMWLTGFDAPCMHTMYVDKPMKGHGLMQAIARVNRVFRDKPAGLVVDYIGVAQNLKSALGQYSQRRPRADRHRRSAKPFAVLLEKYEIVRAMFRPDTKGGFDYRPALDAAATPQSAPRDHGGGDRLGSDAPAGGRGQGDDARTARSGRTAATPMPCWRSPRRLRWPRRATRRASIRDEVGFFQAIRAALGQERARRSGKRPQPSANWRSSRSSAGPLFRRRSSTS